MGWLDPLLALLLLLPAAWLALPGVLAGELAPEFSGTGWWALLACAPALLLLVRRSHARVPVPTMFAAFVAATLLSGQLSDGDTLSASRATITAISSWSALCAGAALHARGRRVLAFGLAALALAFAVPALLGTAPRVQGALQNSGATSEAAVLGAAAALVLWLDSRRSVRALALFAVASYGVFTGAAPVLAGVLVLTCAAALLGLRRPGERRAIALELAVLAIASTGAFAYGRTSAVAPVPAEQTAESQGQGHLGGFAVRLEIAPRALAMFADHPWLGVGPGQFQAAFPPYRSARERELSTSAAAGRETEVEHAHNDYLTTLAEVGLAGGALWLLALGWLARCAWRELASGDLARSALALAVLAGLLNAALRAPLAFNPASASLFFAAAGALISSDAPVPDRRRRTGTALAVLGLALLALQAPRAWNLVRHGRALRLPGELDLSAALAACPDSSLAWSLTARQLAADPARRAEARAAWERALELRPFNFEARMQAGVLAAEAGDAAAAREHWREALRVAPERLEVLRNLLLSEARSGEDAGFEALSSEATGRVQRAWAVEAGAKELLAGDERAAQRLWRFASCAWLGESAQALYDRARAEENATPALKAAQEALAHLRWAREHAAQSSFAAAARSLRQVLRLAPDARPFRLELAAALASEGQREEARAEIERAAPRAADWVKLAPWAGEALHAAGLFATQ